MAMNKREGIRYHVDALPHGRGQMVADLIDGGKLVQTWPVGSPAPFDTVQRAADEANGERRA
jgi:hypothetical protein